jgi:hypothetical protein
VERNNTACSKHRHKCAVLKVLRAAVLNDKEKAKAVIISIARDLDINGPQLLPLEEAQDCNDAITFLHRGQQRVAQLRSRQMTVEARNAICGFISVVSPRDTPERDVTSFRRVLGFRKKSHGAHVKDCIARSDAFDAFDAEEAEHISTCLKNRDCNLPPPPERTVAALGERCSCIAGKGTLMSREVGGALEIELESNGHVTHYAHGGKLKDGGGVVRPL